MIDEVLTSAVRDRIKKLLPYRRQVRPASPSSFAPFVDSEFQRIDGSTREIVASLQALDPIIAALPELGEGGGAAFPEAPADGRIYGRQDADWAPIAAIEGPPGRDGADGKDGQPGQDGQPGRDGVFPEAPTDGQLYARKSGGWAAFEPGAGQGGGAGDGGGTGEGGAVSPFAPFWRIRLLTPPLDNNAAGFATVRFLDKAGADLAVGGSAISSGDINGTYSAANAFDASPDTKWYSRSGRSVGEWVGYSFGKNVSPTAVVLQGDPSYVSGLATEAAVDFSADGRHWQVVTNVSMERNSLQQTFPLEVVGIATSDVRPWYWAPPSASAFATVRNPGGPAPVAVDDSDVGMIVSFANAQDVNNVQKGVTRPLPSSGDWSVTCRITPHKGKYGGTAGCFLYEPSSDRMLLIGPQGDSDGIQAWYGTLTSYYSSLGGLSPSDVFWVRVSLTGDTLLIETSRNGKAWLVLSRGPVSVPFASRPAEMGFGFQQTSAAEGPFTVTCDHWSQSF